MTSNEDFKKALRAGKLSEAFLVAMSHAPELNITTRIVSPQENDQQAENAQPQRGNYLRTQINLIEGKIDNEIGEQLIGDRYPEIQQFHLQQVAQGHQTIQQNLVSLQKMFRLMSAFQQQQKASEQLSWVDMATDVANESLPPQTDLVKLNGNKTPDALKAEEAIQKTQSIPPGNNVTGVESEAGSQGETESKSEPTLPAFSQEEDDSVVDDLLSLADIDKEDEQEQEQEDWGDWLEEDDPQTKAQVLDLKSLNLNQNF
jgi:hypothetical protein